MELELLIIKPKIIPFLLFTDINECNDTLDMNLNTCDGNATCTDSFGGFSCECNPGFMGNGTSCESEISDEFIIHHINSYV